MNVFVSHSWAYSEHYEKIADWIFYSEWSLNGKRIFFNDTSVPRDNPIHDAPNERALQIAIYERIKESHVVVIPTGMYTNHSKWIQKEIAGAALYRRPILAVDPWGQKRSASVVANVASRSVGWNKQSIADAVWNLGKERS